MKQINIKQMLTDAHCKFYKYCKPDSPAGWHYYLALDNQATLIWFEEKPNDILPDYEAITGNKWEKLDDNKKRIKIIDDWYLYEAFYCKYFESLKD
jgi:hypothetical protein